MHRDPPRGFGYKVQGELMRAYAYDLPPGFYNSPLGPNTANISVLAGENFQVGLPGELGGFTTSSIPYSSGYAEVNWRSRSGASGLLGLTYYGHNNQYNEPAFGVVNGGFQQPISKNASLLLAVTNITSAYSLFYSTLYTGIPTPLENGQLSPNYGDPVGPNSYSLTLRLKM